jgi:hypothetical protein
MDTPKEFQDLTNNGDNLNIEGNKINDNRLEDAFNDIRNKPEAALIIIVPNHMNSQKTIQIGSIAKMTALLASAAKEDERFAQALLMAARIIL